MDTVLIICLLIPVGIFLFLLVIGGNDKELAEYGITEPSNSIAFSRWHILVATSPSGKTLFSCRSCGEVTPVPTKRCIGLDGEEKWECSKWPNN